MKAKCKRCSDIIEVTRPREYKSCKCGAIALDYGDGEYYFRVCGSPEDFDGEIEGAPKIEDPIRPSEMCNLDGSVKRAMDIIGEENIGGESKPMKKTAKIKHCEPTKEEGTPMSPLTITESFHNVDVKIINGHTGYIYDAESGKRMAMFHIKE